MSEYALRLQNSQDTAARVRMGDALGLMQAGSLTARSGVKNDGGGAVSVVAGTMQVQVTPLMAWVDGGSSTAQAGYPFILDATKTLTLADGHATLARIDTIAVVIHENAYDGSGLTDAAVVVVQGTAGSGVAPTLPATALPLRDVNVPAGLSTGTGGLSSGNLSTDRRKYLAAAGGIVRVASSTERDAMTAVNGTAVYREDTDALEIYDGTSWDTFLPDAGTKVYRTSVTVAAGATFQAKAVTFPSSFGTAPAVVCQVGSTGVTAGYYANAYSVTATGCTVRVDKAIGSAPGSDVTVQVCLIVSPVQATLA